MRLAPALLGAVVLAGLGTSGATAAADGRVVVRFADPSITESSGLVVVRGDLVTVNDSGGEPVLFSVDAATGETVATTRFAAAQTDVEALAPSADDPDRIWVGDLGNNDGSRSTVTVTGVTVDGSSDLGSATSYDLRYPGGEKPDAEALLCDPTSGRLYVVTKAILGGTVYAAPARLRPDRLNALRPVGTVGSVITDGAFWPDGRHVVLRNYGEASVYTFPGLDLVGTMGLPEQEQGEGLAIDADGSLLLTSEGAHAPVLRVRPSAELRRELSGTPAPSDDPSPSALSPSAPSGEDGPAPAGDDSGLDTVLWILVGGVVAAAGLLVVVFRRWYPAE